MACPHGYLATLIRWHTFSAMVSLRDSIFRFAHDVGNPLMIALTLTELLKEDAALTASQRADVLRIHQAARDISDKVSALREQAQAGANHDNG